MYETTWDVSAPHIFPEFVRHLYLSDICVYPRYRAKDVKGFDGLEWLACRWHDPGLGTWREDTRACPDQDETPPGMRRSDPRTRARVEYFPWPVGGVFVPEGWDRRTCRMPVARETYDAMKEMSTIFRAVQLTFHELRARYGEAVGILSAFAEVGGNSPRHLLGGDSLARNPLEQSSHLLLGAVTSCAPNISGGCVRAA
jgi:hypothetical protein